MGRWGWEEGEYGAGGGGGGFAFYWRAALFLAPVADVEEDEEADEESDADGERDGNDNSFVGVLGERCWSGCLRGDCCRDGCRGARWYGRDRG
jgi:hypothetical protein